jgi:polyisoprenoid-binding protein YceI
MKKTFLISLLIISFAISLKAQKSLAIDINKSKVHWSGSYSFDYGGHEGTVKIKEGQLLSNEDKITGGSFVIDMNTIVNTDDDFSQDLVDHLKSEDFFEVKKYPTAQLVIKNVKYHGSNNTKDSQVYIRITGNFTIKNITQSVWFEGVINPENTFIFAKFKIDRTQYGVNYQSKGLGASIKDGIISDAIELKIELYLK